MATEARGDRIAMGKPGSATACRTHRTSDRRHRQRCSRRDGIVGNVFENRETDNTIAPHFPMSGVDRRRRDACAAIPTNRPALTNDRIKNKKPGRSRVFFGAVEKTRTSTGCPTATSTLRVYQFRHDRIVVGPTCVDGAACSKSPLGAQGDHDRNLTGTETISTPRSGSPGNAGLLPRAIPCTGSEKQECRTNAA